MVLSHFIALIPMMVLLIISIIWWGKGLLHLMLIGYTGVLAFIAVSQQWEILFLPLCLGTMAIALILFIMAMSKGDWL